MSHWNTPPGDRNIPILESPLRERNSLTHDGVFIVLVARQSISVDSVGKLERTVLDRAKRSWLLVVLSS